MDWLGPLVNLMRPGDFWAIFWFIVFIVVAWKMYIPGRDDPESTDPDWYRDPNVRRY